MCPPVILPERAIDLPPLLLPHWLDAREDMDAYASFPTYHSSPPHFMRAIGFAFILLPGVAKFALCSGGDSLPQASIDQPSREFRASIHTHRGSHSYSAAPRTHHGDRNFVTGSVCSPHHHP